MEYEKEIYYKNINAINRKIVSYGFLNSTSDSISDDDEAKLNYLKDISLFVHQRHDVISTILTLLIDQKVDIFETIVGFRKTLQDMHAILIYKTAINMKDIYVSMLI